MRYVVLMLAMTLAGCGNAVRTGTSAALSGFDLEEIATTMAQSIAADPEVQAAQASEGPLTVVVLPVENRLRGQVLPLGQARAFTASVRQLLSEAQPDGFTWVNNRDTFYALRRRELEGFDPGPAPEAVSPEYALQATFTSLANDNRRYRTSDYVCDFSLVSLQDRQVLWADAYNVRKFADKNFLD